jgi:hypothetical protein
MNTVYESVFRDPRHRRPAVRLTGHAAAGVSSTSASGQTRPMSVSRVAAISSSIDAPVVSGG